MKIRKRITTKSNFHLYCPQTLPSPQTHLKKKTSKAKMTSEEYKLQNNSVKKRNKKRDFEKGGKPNIPDLPKLVSAESTNSEKKQPLMITKIVMKGDLLRPF